MERKFTKFLLEWKRSPSRMPLIVTGARQVGKTYGLLSFGKVHYKNVVYFNFESEPDLQQLFERDLHPSRILRELSVRSGETILEKDTLVIFDEVQVCERALTSLKYFNEEAPAYHIAAAGSLLGLVVNRDKYSFPVGKVDRYHLYPLDFEEFLWALGRKPAVGMIRECFADNTPFSSHDVFLDIYKTYLLVGGMPQVVEEYVKKQDFNFIRPLQKNITDAYISDMAKYSAPTETNRLMAAYESIPAQLAKDNHKFQYKIIKSGGRAYEYAPSLDWLQASGVIHKCVKASEGKFPLSLFAAQDSFKVYFSDIGLLSAKYNLPPNILLSDFSGFENIKGSLAENYVMIAMKTNQYDPFYWESQGKAEVDFVFQDKNGNIIPLEVKSSENARSKSLMQYISKYEPPYSIRVSAKNFGFENNIKSVPLYAIFCI